MDIGASEAEAFWTAFLRKLRQRGLHGVKLVISDAPVAAGHLARRRAMRRRVARLAGSSSLVARLAPGRPPKARPRRDVPGDRT